MDLHAERFNVVGSIRTSSEIGQVELDLIPAVIQAHRHRANEGLHTGRGLVYMVEKGVGRWWWRWDSSQGKEFERIG